MKRTVKKVSGFAGFLVGVTMASAVWAEPVATTIVPASAYVQDGLVGMWDGIENAGAGLHDDTATIWSDISRAKKGGDFTVHDGASFLPFQRAPHRLQFAEHLHDPAAWAHRDDA